jgi:hypothetical protein
LPISLANSAKKQKIERSDGIVLEIDVGWTAGKLEKCRQKLESQFARMQARMQTRANRTRIELLHGYEKKWIDEVMKTVKKEVYGTSIGWKGNLVVADRDGLVAPATTNSWTLGKLHRDKQLNKEEANEEEANESTSTQYTCIFLVDEIKDDNGLIEVYEGSRQVTLEPKNGERTIRMMGEAGMHQRLMTGKKGTLIVFDSLLLHRSRPNKTEANRWTLNWVIHKPGS